MEHFYQQFDGWFDFENIYRDAVKRFPSGSKFAEIGVYKGRSSFFLATEIVNSKKDIAVFCVDRFTWEEKAGYRGYLTRFCEEIEKRGLERILLPHCGLSVDVATRFPDEIFDFIFIDADHTYESVSEDLRAWFPKLTPGGIIAGHDWSNEFPGVEKAVREFFIDNPKAIEMRPPRSWWVQT